MTDNAPPPEVVSYCTETWSCPMCPVQGQVNSANPAGTNLAAHIKVLHPGAVT